MPSASGANPLLSSDIHNPLPVVNSGNDVQESLPHGLYEALSVTAILVGEIDPPPQPAGSSVPDERSLSHQLLPLLPELPYTDGYTIWLASPRV